MRRYLSLFLGILMLAAISFTISSCGVNESEEYIQAFRSSGSTFGIYPIVSENDISAEFSMGDETYHVGPVSIVDERHLTSIKEEIIDKGRNGMQMCLLIQLNLKGSAIMADYTENHLKERVAILINDELIVATFIQATITSGYIRTTVNREDGRSVKQLLDLEDYLD